MEIEELRLEALKLAVGSQGGVLPPEKIVEAASRYADFLMGKAKADMTAFTVAAHPGASMLGRNVAGDNKTYTHAYGGASPDMALRTLESEGQKWDEEARRKSEPVTLTSEELFKALWAHHDSSLKTCDGSCPSSEHHGC